jgi:LacI family transcriptional regulator
MTVSRALNGRPGVAGSTRQRVLAAAAALGYRPNKQASRLRTGKPDGLVGLVLATLADPLIASLTVGVEQTCAENGARIVLASSNGDPATEGDLIADLVARGVDGLIVVPAGDDHTHLNVGQRSGVPLVLARCPPAGVVADCVVVDEARGAYRACRHLFEQGHRRIGFLGSTRSWAGSERFRGYHLAHGHAEVAVDDRMVCRAREVAEVAENAARGMLTSADPPSALLVAGPSSLLGVLRAVAAQPPVAVVGFDVECADVVPYPLGVVSHDSVELGRAAAGLLFDQRRPSAAPRQVTIETSLVQTGPAPK